MPGAADRSAFSRVLAEGRCVISQISPERWALERFGHPSPTAPGRTYTWAAGQIDDIYGFDPTFFGISPREASQMDPQQRLLLQVAWEAFEDAGIAPSTLAGSQTAVYVGASSLDYSSVIQLDAAIADTQMMTGNTLSIIANRLSYIFDFRGPSFTIDTACSSSLIALHEAAEAIRTGRIETAVVAGVNLLLHPAPFVGFARASMLSPQGLCRAFDAGGDGYVRSEGAVVVVLRNADAARADDNRIAGLVAGSGSNCDGRTVGLSLPSAITQAQLLADVYGRFGLDPADLAFVEAHGTGTRVGDPIEADAIGKVLGQRRGGKLLIGSVKTNVGHLEPASGLVGLLKVLDAFDNDTLAASLHFETPNPDIPFDDLNIEVAATATRLAPSDRPRIAGINSFGFGGANAHVVIEEVAPCGKTETPRFDAPLLLSAESREALRALADRAAAAIQEGNGAASRRFANAAAYQRDRLRYRAVIPVSDPDRRIEILKAYGAGEATDGIIEGEAIAAAAAPVFLYSGNGSQWAGMGHEAYQADRTFRLSFDRVDRCFMGVAGWSLLSMLFSQDLESEIERTEIAQPLLFALQIALTDALASHGLTPAAVVGHSVGEVAAATVSGALSLEDGVRVIHARSTHQEITRHLGGMAAALVPVDEAREGIAGYDRLEVAAINSPRSVTISGPAEELERFVADARKARRAVKRLDLDYPFHCSLVDPIREPLTAALGDLQPGRCRVSLVSSMTGDVIDGTALGADYWWDNVRRPVRFQPAIERLLDDGHRMFVEIGPRPVLTGYVGDIGRSRQTLVRVVASLKQGKTDDPAPIRSIAIEAVANGAAIDDVALFGPDRHCQAGLPHYPWQNTPYRFANTAEEVTLLKPLRNKLLGWRLHGDAREWFNILDLDLYPWLGDHRVEETAVFPAAAFAEMMLAAGHEIHGPDADIELTNLDIFAPLVFEGSASREVRTVANNATVTILSRARLAEADWTPHAKCEVRKAPSLTPAVATTDAAGEASAAVTATTLYAITERFGLRYGPVFRRAHRVAISGPTLEARLLAPDPATALLGFNLDPTLLDSCFHALFAFLDGSDDLPEDVSALPIRFRELRRRAGAADPAAARIAITRHAREIVETDLDLLDADGAVVATLRGARFQIVPLARKTALDEHCYGTETVLLARRGDASAFVQPRMPDPRAIAAERGLVAEREPEPDDGALLLDIAVRRAAADALAALFPSGHGGMVADLVRDGVLAGEAVPLVQRLLEALAEAGLAQCCDERWSIEIDEETPDLADVVQTLAAEFPSRIAEIALVAALRERLAAVIAPAGAASGATGPSDGLLEHFLTQSPATAPLSSAVLEVVSALSEAWPQELPLRVLLVGASDPALVAGLARCDRRRVAATIVDPDATVLDRARLRRDGALWLEWVRPEDVFERDGDHAFDVIVSAGGLSRLGSERLASLARTLAKDGCLFAVEPAPSLLRDALFGLDAAWWSDTVDPEAPVGSLLGQQDWVGRLADAGLTDVTAERLAAASTEAFVVTARRGESSEANVEAAPRMLRLVAHDSRWASRLADAFGATVGAGAMVCERLGLADAAGPATPSRASGDPLGAAMADPDQSGDTVESVVLFGPIASGPTEQALADQLDALGRYLVSLGSAEQRVWVITCGAFPHSHAGDPAHAAIWHFARVAANEFPHLALRLVDIAPQLATGEAATRLAAEFARPNDEHEILLDVDCRHGLRLTPRPLALARPGAARQKLVPARRGWIDSLAWMPATKPELGSHDVEIEVIAAGLNFRDVMWSLGLLPHEALEGGFAGPTLGMECSGTVKRVGSAVTATAVGETVLAFAPACLATHVVVEERGLIGLPEGVDPCAAATIPVAFLTAYYALVELAGLGEGETVLVHGGAGGVGLAALQIARWRGARVIATAGTPEKRALLAHLGAEAVFDSRSMAFADAVRAHMGGAGVDVVLNSLAGEAMERSLELLTPFGRFLELGKRDFFANTPVGLRPFRQNLSYYGIDADQLLTHRAPLAMRLFREIMALFADGVLTALPYRTFAADRVRDAFRLMQQSGHIGKIVVTPPVAAAAREEPGAPFAIDPAASYLIAGGTGGFGFATAKWLVGLGARHVVLASRSGTLDAAAGQDARALREAGVAIDVRPVDLTDRDAVRRCVEDIVTAGPPLKGVFHTAMVLDDGLIANLDAARHAAALAPKVGGVEALEAAVADLDLDLFVLFSSITTAIGNPGQANYVAANGYLEAVARRRRAAGKPALAIGWGPIGDVGVLARDKDVSELIGRKVGRNTLTAAEALKALGTLLDDGAAVAGEPVVHIARLDWAAAAKDLKLLATPLFSRISFSSAGSERSGMIDLEAELEGLAPAEAIERVSDLLAVEMSQILKLPVEQIEKHRPLSSIGMDSLMALELRMAAEQRLGVDIPLMSLASGATLADIARRVIDRRHPAGDINEEEEALVKSHVGDSPVLEDEAAVGALKSAIEDRTSRMRKVI